MNEQTGQQQLRELTEREGVVVLVDSYVTSLDEPSSFDENWARAHVRPGENPPDPLIAPNLLDADAVHTSNGWRFERFAPHTIWRSEESPADSGRPLR